MLGFSKLEKLRKESLYHPRGLILPEKVRILSQRLSLSSGSKMIRLIRVRNRWLVRKDHQAMLILLKINHLEKLRCLIKRIKI